MIMEPSDVIASKIRTLLTNPVIDDFLSLARAHDDDWAPENSPGKLRDISPDVLPHTWAITIDDARSGSRRSLDPPRPGRLHRRSPAQPCRSRRGAARPRAVARWRHWRVCRCAAADAVLTLGDKLLFAGTRHSHSRMLWNLMNDVALHYVMTGTNLPRTLIGRWLNARAA
ncbi:MAG: hypothetical protein U5O39_07285 [Gammaproteobacteria bacterium]|nr:hypothetical protein [Gammaproteobacteria bacterium]